MPTIVLEMERLRNPYSGLGQYCFQLGRAFAAELPAVPLRAEAQSLGFVCLVPKEREGEFGVGMAYKTVRPWHKIFGPALGESLWHCMHQDSEYLPRSRKTPLAITIHDLNFLDRPDYSEAKKQRRLAAMQQKIKRANGLVYISEYVRQWVHHHLKVPTKTIESVIYNGGAMDFRLPTSDFRPPTSDFRPQISALKTLKQSKVKSQKSKVESRFLFSIGIHPKKNYHVLMPLLAEFEEYRWVIAGPDSRGYRRKIEQEAERFGVADRLEFCGPVGDEEKIEYYKNCVALLFPSLSEGFGLPVVEAMSLGKPVFLSDRTSLPEIGGSEAYYFKDFEPRTLKETFSTGIKDFESDPEKPARMKSWAAQFTWEKAATQYLEFYKKILDTQQSNQQ